MAKLLTNQLRFVACHELIEDVVAPLSRQLERHSRLLQQIYQTIIIIIISWYTVCSFIKPSGK